MTGESSPETESKSLQSHLRDLVHGLQAASHYLAALRNRMNRAGDDDAAETAVSIEKALQQLERAQNGFRGLRDRLFRERNQPGA